ncbi:hypothetical protein F5884DRAFT_888903, partial [Xylogone sp. PMI_703]
MESRAMPIAVVGVGGRFPGDASDPEKLWKMVSEGRHALSEVPKSRYNVDAFYHPNPERSGTTNARGAHFLQNDITSFDAPFFSITANEAEAMDPQQRLMLEVAYEALENAGMSLEDVSGTSMGSFVATFSHDYSALRAKDFDNMPTYHATGVSGAIMSNRLAWYFNLKGSSISLDTACSSSLVALHLACQSLRLGEITTALVGGVNLMVTPEIHLSLSSLHFLSPDGKSQAFDANANGYSRGEGAAVVILKPLDAALRDGNTIRAIIRGTGVNQDGRTPGITLPSMDAQATLIKATYAEAGLDFGETDYFEAHGTGTQEGDAIECAAIASVLKQSRPRSNPLLIGSIKTNVGHMEGASGVAGLVKAIYMLEEGQIPPSLWFEHENPRLNLKRFGMKVPTTLTSWPNGGPKRISINSFGFGGTNAHCIVEKADGKSLSNGLSEVSKSSEPLDVYTVQGVEAQFSQASTEDTPILLMWSSADQAGIHRVTDALKNYIEAERMKNAEDKKLLNRLAFTLSKGRSKLPWKATAVCSSIDELLESLNQTPKATRNDYPPRIIFVFTGQGAQWPQMGKELLCYPIFQRAMRAATKYLRTLGAPWDLIEEILKKKDKSMIYEPDVSQAACTALQVALVDLALDCGIKPVFVIGHSSGEIAAAYAKGSIGREAAWKLAYLRGMLSKKMTKKGAMIAVGISKELSESYIDLVTSGKLVVACVNSPSSVTLSGDVQAVQEIQDLLDREGIFNRRLSVQTAYHSPHMQSIAAEYLEKIGELQKPSTPNDGVVMYSSVTGECIDDESLRNGKYWVRNLLGRVEFSLAMEGVFDQLSKSSRRSKSQSLLIEVGPHSALRGPIRHILNTRDSSRIDYTSLIERERDGIRTLLSAVGRAAQHGASIDFDQANNVRHRGSLMLSNMPPYPWNHDNSYWHNDNVGRAWLHRKHPRHDLVGALSEFSTEKEPTWRNYLRVSEIPWVEQHNIQGSIVYPFAGMLAMAIEATIQMSDKSRRIRGIRFRDVSAEKALVVPAEGQLETTLQFKPWRMGSRSPDMFWYEFIISSRGPIGDWVQHCIGLVSAVYDSPANNTFLDEQLQQSERYREKYNRISSMKLDPQNMQDLYEKYARLGFQFGELFQNAIEVRTGLGKALYTLEIPDTRAQMPENFEHPHLIHPATLDAIIQMSWAPAIGSDVDRASIPRFMQSMFISCQIDSGPGEKLYGASEYTEDDIFSTQTNIVVSDATWKEPLVIIEGLSNVLLPPQSEMQNGLADAIDFSFNHWDIDILSSPKPHVETLLQAACYADMDADYQTLRELEHAAFIICKRVTSKVHESEVSGFAPHHQQLYRYMQQQFAQGVKGQLPYQDQDMGWSTASPVSDDKVLARVAAASVDGELLCRVGESLTDILFGRKEPLEVLMEGGLWTSIYRSSITAPRGNFLVRKLTSLLSHKKGLKILEVGAGTGGTTSSFWSAFSSAREASSRVESYTFTDLSTGFFEAAANNFHEWAAFMNFKVLDIEKDPAMQGFEPASYDLVIASNVLHATKQIGKSLEHCRTLLKPGGNILLVELTTPLTRTQISFGILPGWWLGSNDSREWGPLLSEQRWNLELQRNGFSGLDLCFPDHPTIQSASIMMSTADESQKPNQTQDILILRQDDADLTTVSFSSVLHKICSANGSQAQELAMADLATVDVTGKTCISLLELTKPFLYQMGSDGFNHFQRLVVECKSILWLTHGTAMDKPCPETNLAVGLTRSIRNEMPTLRFIVLDLDVDSIQSLEDVCQASVDLLNKQDDVEGDDWEYALRNGCFYVQRVYPDLESELLVKSGPSTIKTVKMKFKQGDRPLKMNMRTAGLLDTIEFVDDARYMEPLGENDVEIETKAFGLNFLDIMISMGQVPGGGIGAECSGVVSRIGRNVTSLSIGQRVLAIGVGTYRTFYRAPVELVYPLPEDMSFEEGAALPIAFCTAYYSLLEVARLKKGESILIHSAAGGVGQAAIILAKHIGGEVYATVSSDAKKQFLMKTYGIPESHIFNSRDHSFALGIARMTNGRGVDIVINSLAGESLRQTWLCLAPFGRFIELGKKDIVGNTGLDMIPFMKNISFIGVNLVHIIQERPQLMHSLLKDIMSLRAKGVIVPIQPVTRMSLTNIEDAFRMMQSGKHIGKIVLTVDDEAVVPQVIPRREIYKFRPDATYLLPGGLGGIGSVIAGWMVKNGARNLVITSRSGAKTPESIKLLDEWRYTGANVGAFACDISSVEGLKQVLDSIAGKFPPIAGVITFAMQLQDGLFANMTYDQYIAAVRPKAHITSNLHELLPKDLDFFICMSSIGGIIGSRGQANYNAGNTYQDAIARYRASLGLKGISINLGVVSDVGWASSTNAVENVANAVGRTIDTADIIAAVQGAMSNQLPPQSILGLPTGGMLRASEREVPFYLLQSRLAHMQLDGTQQDSTLLFESTKSLESALLEAKTPSDAIDAVCFALVTKLSRALAMPRDEIILTRPANSYGVDSLVAVEIRTWAVREAKSDISVFDILNNTPIEALAEKVAMKSALI